MENAIETYLPIFSGFYNTLWDSESIISNEAHHFGVNADVIFDAVDWEDYYETLAEEICDRICEFLMEKNLITDYKFQKLVSPRAYNFSNDSIDIKVVPNRDVLKKHVLDNQDAWHEYIRRRYTSYDGFLSYYSNNSLSDEWDIDDAMDDAHKLGTVIEFVLYCILDDTPSEYDLYYDVESVHMLPYNEAFMEKYMNKNNDGNYTNTPK